jgi:uncharacterized protein (DUF1810 family)
MMTNPPDKNTLDRFLEAQRTKYTEAFAQLRSGKKSTHWMWFIFPQLRGLGTSGDSHFYGIQDLTEASAYLEHPTLGARLIECTNAVLLLRDSTLPSIFGGGDSRKFISCMTLFALPPTTSNVFRAALQQFNHGVSDPLTLQLLKGRRNLGHDT